jgi:hypothetical protein
MLLFAVRRSLFAVLILNVENLILFLLLINVDIVEIVETLVSGLEVGHRSLLGHFDQRFRRSSLDGAGV